MKDINSLSYSKWRCQYHIVFAPKFRVDCTMVKLPNPKYIPKPYEQMQYPGQRCQIDVKFVPTAYLVGAAAEQKYY